MKNLLTVLISLTLIFLPLNAQNQQTSEVVQQVHEKYPNAKISVISFDEFQKIQKSHKNTQIIYLAQNENNDTNESKKEEIKQKQKTTNTTSAGARLRVPDLNFSGSGDSAVIFVIIGAIVVVALVVYAGEYLYEVIATDKQHSYWIDNSFIYSNFYNDYTQSSGSMAGYKLSFGFDGKNTKVGVSAEAGTFDFSFFQEESRWLDANGAYFMAGPTVRFYPPTDKTAYLFAEMLGGKSDNKNINTLGQARLGVSKTFQNNLILGLSLGAIFVGLNDDEGILEYKDEFETTTSFEMGYKF